MENSKAGWTVHAEFVVLLITLIGGFYTLDTKIERQSSRCDHLYEIWVNNTDRHYQMWMETQKEIKQIYMDRYQSEERRAN